MNYHFTIFLLQILLFVVKTLKFYLIFYLNILVFKETENNHTPSPLTFLSAMPYTRTMLSVRVKKLTFGVTTLRHLSDGGDKDGAGTSIEPGKRDRYGGGTQKDETKALIRMREGGEIHNIVRSHDC